MIIINIKNKKWTMEWIIENFTLWSIFIYNKIKYTLTDEVYFYIL